MLGGSCEVDGECRLNPTEARPQLDDIAYTRLPSAALHHSADVSVHFGEQEDGNRSPGLCSVFTWPYGFGSVYFYVCVCVCGPAESNSCEQILEKLSECTAHGTLKIIYFILMMILITF